MMAAGTSALKATWTMAPTGPSARSGACAAADGAGAYVFGGYVEQADMSRSVTNDLWRFDGGDWRLVAPAAPDAPPARLCATLAHTGDALVLMGGWDGADGFFDDVWTFREGAWTREDATLPGPRSRHAACTLPDGRVVAVTHREVFVYDPSDRSVSIQETSGAAPSSRGLHAMARVGSNSLVVTCGAAQSGEMTGDAYVLDCDTWEWRALSATGPEPRAAGAAAPLDDNRVLLVGGAARYDMLGLAPLDDVWCLDVEEDTWTRVEPNSGFGPRNAHVLCRLGDGGFVVNGGWKPFVSTYDDTLRLEVASS